MKVVIKLMASLFLFSSLLAGCGGGGGSNATFPSNTTDTNTNTTTNVAPSAPTALSLAQLSGSSVQLTWTAATGGTGSITTYTIYRNGVAIGHTSAAGTASAPTTYTDSGLIVGSTYIYAVTASNGVGMESGKSPLKTLIPTTGGTAVNGYTLQPGESAPTLLTTSMISNKSFYWACASTKAYGAITFPADSAGNPQQGTWTQLAPTVLNNTITWNAVSFDVTSMPIIITATSSTGAFQSLDTFNINAIGLSYYVVSDARANTFTLSTYRLYYGSNALAFAKAFSGN